MIRPIGWDTMGWEGWKSARMASLLEGKENIWKHARSEELLPLSSILTAISLTAEQPILFSSDTAAGKRPMRSLKRRFVSLICLLQLGEPEWCVSACVLSSRPAIQVSIIYIYNHIYMYICRSIESIEPMIHWLDMGWFNGKITGNSKKSMRSFSLSVMLS